MRLSFKVAAGLVLVMTVILTLYGVVRVRREAALFEQDMRRDHRHVGNTLSLVTGEMWRSEGPAKAIALLRRVDRLKDHLDIRWISGKAPEGQAVLDSDGKQVLHTTVPVVVEGEQVGAVELGESLAEQSHYIRTTVFRSVVVVLILVASGAALTQVMGYLLVGRPVQRLVAKARQVGAGDFTGELKLQRHDELGELGVEMDLMSRSLAEATARAASESEARIRALEQLRHADRLRVVGQLAAGVAHELGSPLCVVAGRAQLIARGDLDGEAIRTSAASINAQAERMAAIVRQLLNFARRRYADRAPCDLRELVSAAATMLRSEARRKDVELRLAAAGSEAAVIAHVDAGQIQQVVVNLLVNAIQAMPRGGIVDLAVESRRLQRPDRQESPGAPNEPAEGPQQWALIRVDDEGEGMDPAHREHIFEPFFTTKDVGQGTGLGLSVSLGIVEEHGGWIGVESTPGAGSRFSVYLPLGAPQDDDGRGPREPGSKPGVENDHETES